MFEDLLQELADREAIKELKARYFRMLDTQDWDGFRQCLADDASFVLMDRDPIDGADAFVANTREVLRGARTVHQGHMPELTIDGPAEASGVWVMADYVEWPSDPETGERRGMKGYGHYNETYRKVDGAWKIATWRLSYLRIDPLPREPLPDQVLGGPDVLRDGELQSRPEQPVV